MPSRAYNDHFDRTFQPVKPPQGPRTEAEYRQEFAEARERGLRAGWREDQLATFDQWLETCAEAAEAEAHYDLTQRHLRRPR